MVKFVIVRHGYSKGNKEKRFTGQTDVPLDEVGYEQAECTAKYVLENFKIDCIHSSDLSRAYETVRPVAEALGLPIHTHRELREVDVGKWQGVLVEDIKKMYPESYAFYRDNPGLARFDGGEAYADLMKRGSETFEKIARENDGKTVLVGTHGGIIRTLRVAWDGLPPEAIKDFSLVPNGSVTVAEYDNGNVNWLTIGYCDHLTTKTTEIKIK